MQAAFSPHSPICLCLCVSKVLTPESLASCLVCHGQRSSSALLVFVLESILRTSQILDHTSVERSGAGVSRLAPPLLFKIPALRHVTWLFLDLADIRYRVDSWSPLVAPICSSFVILPCSSIPIYHNSLLYQFVVCPLVVHIDTSYVVYLIAISFLYQFCDDFCCNSFLYAHDVLSGTSCVVSLCNFNPGSVDDVCC